MKSATLRAVESQVESALVGRVLSPFGLRPRQAPATFPTGIPQVDALTGGVPRGAVTEIFGPASSGRSSLLLSLLAQVTAREEVCAVVDATDAFNPEIAAAAGVELSRVLWVRCRSGAKAPEEKNKDDVTARLKPCPSETLPRSFSTHLTGVERALKATDLLLQAGGLGLIAVDLGDVPPPTARRVPLTSWFRFRRAVEDTPTALVVIEEEPYAKSCAALVVKLSAVSHQPSAKTALPTHAQLLQATLFSAEVVRAAVRRKPVRSVAANFESRATWVG